MGSLTGSNKTRWPLHRMAARLQSVPTGCQPETLSCLPAAAVQTAAQWSALYQALSWHVAGVVHWRDCGGGE